MGSELGPMVSSDSIMTSMPSSSVMDDPFGFVNSRELKLDRSPQDVRTTITIVFSSDGRRFASTHGDHTVKIFTYPQGNLHKVLEGHPRTPWAASFHPKLPYLLATGCVGGECRLWDIESGECVATRKFPTAIACLAFHPDGDILAVATGRTVITWRCMERLVQGSPSKVPSERRDARSENVLAIRSGIIHLVGFNGQGNRILMGAKNRQQPNPTGDRAQRLTLHVTLHEFNSGEGNGQGSGERIGGRLLDLPRVAAFNQAGVHISPCGEKLAACIETTDNGRNHYHICILSLEQKNGGPVGTVLLSHIIDSERVLGLTTTRFSPSGRQLLTAYSLPHVDKPHMARRHTYAEDMSALADHAMAKGMGNLNSFHSAVAEIYRIGDPFEVVERIGSTSGVAETSGESSDMVNCAVYAPATAEKPAVLYGTTEGRIRMFTTE